MASKYALVPYGMMDAHARESRNLSYARLRNLDGSMRQILDDPALGEDQKYAQYKRVLQMHENMQRSDPRNRVVERTPQALPQEDHDYLEGVSNLWPEQPAARAYNPDALRQRVVADSPAPPTKTWDADELASLKRLVGPTETAQQIVDALEEHLGQDVDYANAEKRSGLLIRKKKIPRVRLHNVIKTIADPTDYPKAGALELARVLADSGASKLIRNKVLQKHLFTPQAPEKFKGTTFKTPPERTPPRQQRPSRKGFLERNWKSLYKD